jgi:hypothetical protein
MMGMLFVDSTLMLCSDYMYHDGKLVTGQKTYCKNEEWVEWGNTQYEWILQTLKEWEENEHIIWKVTVTHYPIVPLHYQQFELDALQSNYLKILQEHEFDLYLCGHEHVLGYVAMPHD